MYDKTPCKWVPCVAFTYNMSCKAVIVLVVTPEALRVVETGSLLTLSCPSDVVAMANIRR
jgi:hypothetical protein